MLLALDTATRSISLALHDGQRLLAEHSWHSDNNHTTQLAPAVAQLFAQVTPGMDALSAVAVSVGPGSYTGLRIGIALAKGIASAHKLPLIGRTTLDTLAAAAPYQASAGLIAVVNAGRGRIIAQTYRWSSGGELGVWAGRGQAAIMTWDALLQSIDAPALITGEVDAAAEQRITQAADEGTPVQLAPAAFRLRRAGFLAQAAWAQLHASDDPDTAFDPARLSPIYLKSDG